MDDKTFDEGMSLLFATFPNRKIQGDAATKKNILKTWRMLLQDLSNEDFLCGVLRICRETTELYPDTNLVALIRQKAVGDVTDLSTQAMMAWEAVRKAIQQYGHCQSVQFDDPVIHSCIQALGGWIELCCTDIGEMIWREKKFKELYPVFAAGKQKHPQKLIGQIEKENRLKGYEERTKLITQGKDDGRTEWDEFNPIPGPILIETTRKQLPKLAKALQLN